MLTRFNDCDKTVKRSQSYTSSKDFHIIRTYQASDGCSSTTFSVARLLQTTTFCQLNLIFNTLFLFKFLCVCVCVYNKKLSNIDYNLYGFPFNCYFTLICAFSYRYYQRWSNPVWKCSCLFPLHKAGKCFVVYERGGVK